MTSVCPVCQSPISSGELTCKTCGFRLSGATQEFKPVDLEGESVVVDDKPQRASLKMIRGSQPGTTYRLSDGKTTIGRNPQCDIFLNDMTVSRQHAEIDDLKDSYVITDMKSYNGVWVNNKSIASKVLENGDFVQIGKFGFLFEMGND